MRKGGGGGGESGISNTVTQVLYEEGGRRE